MKMKCRLLQSALMLRCLFFLTVPFFSLVCHSVCVSQTVLCVSQGPFATDLYIPLQQRCNFTDRVNFHKQLVRDKEREKASPPHRHAVCLSVSFLLLDRAPCCLAEHERDNSTTFPFYFQSRLHWWKCQQALKLVKVTQHVSSIKDPIFI